MTQPFRVVIDPGHGGSDEGTVFKDGPLRVSEKHITLELAKEAARNLRARGYEVILTRTTDREIALPARTALANRLKADVFLSIHMNSTSSHEGHEPEGIETFILNNTTDASSRRLAQLENSIFQNTVADVPEQMDVAMILKDLRLDANLSESKKLACAVQNSLVTATSRVAQVHPNSRNRGVKQALFHVLLGADMPSVLVEAGFLTSPRDRALVLSHSGRGAISSAIAQAVEQYRDLKAGHRTHDLSRCKVR